MGDDWAMTPGELRNAHAALADFWHPVALSCEVGVEPVAVRLAGHSWVLVRLGSAISSFVDACPHRRARLSAGHVSDGTLQCMYHGWRFANDGGCVEIPGLEDTAAIPARAALHSPAEVAGREGLGWLAPEPPPAPLPRLGPPAAPGGARHATVPP